MFSDFCDCDFVQNLPLNNPVLIVEVLVEKQTQQDEDEGNQKMKFTFAKEDLMEVSPSFYLLKKLDNVLMLIFYFRVFQVFG